jgi:dipeptide/tripeptide permease
VYALLRWAINAGWAMGPALAGVLSQISYFWIFVGNAIATATFGILTWLFIPANAEQKTAPISHMLGAFQSILESLQVTLRDKYFVQVFVASFPIAFIFNQSLSTLSIEVQKRGFDEIAYGTLLGFNGLIIILTEIPLSLWVSRQSQRWMMVGGYVLIGFGFGIYALGSSLSNLYWGMAIFTLGEMIALPVSLAYMSQLAPAHMRGRYMGIWGLAWSISMMGSTSAGMQMHAALGSEFWHLMSVLGLIGAAIMAIQLRPRCHAVGKEQAVARI